jgi:hypothetical protein
VELDDYMIKDPLQNLIVVQLVRKFPVFKGFEVKCLYKPDTALYFEPVEFSSYFSEHISLKIYFNVASVEAFHGGDVSSRRLLSCDAV